MIDTPKSVEPPSIDQKLCRSSEWSAAISSVLATLHPRSLEKKNRSQERSVTLINSSLHPSHPGKYFYRAKEKNLVERNKKKIKRTRIIPDLFSLKKKKKNKYS